VHVTDTVSRSPAFASGRTGRLVGRDADLATLRALVTDDGPRLVTVTGPVGVGKSRLVAELAAELAVGELPVVSVPLASVSDAGIAADAVIEAATSGDGRAASPAEALWLVAGGGPVLVVLDDADEVEGLADLVQSLIDGYPALTVLLTRVRPIKVRGEHVLAVRPFGDPDADGGGPAVELFAARASAADATFALDPTTRAAIASICRTLGGSPLAIEVAAARVATVPPAVMAQQLARSTEVLHQAGTSGVAERHRSVDAALDWSTGLLSVDAAGLLAQLSVFEGDIPLAAAQQVSEPRRSQTELLDLVSELVDSHLLEQHVVGDDELVLTLDPLVRRHARRRLVTSGAEGRVRDAHAAYWSTRCRVDPATAARHWPDVLAALDRRVTTGQADEALQLAVTAVSDLPLPRGAQESLLPLVESVLGDGSVSDEALVARTLMWATVNATADEQGPTAYAAWTSRRLREAIELARSSGDDAALLEALELVVSTLGVTFDLEGAVASAYEGLALAARLDDQSALARFEVWVAMAQGAGGDTAAMAQSARSAYERGLRVGEDTAVVYAGVMLIGLSPQEQGPVPLLPLDDLLRRAEALRQPMLVMHVLVPMALGAMAMGDKVGALRSLGRLLLIADGLERTWPMASVAPLMLTVAAAMSRGAMDDAVRVRESMAELEPLLPQVVPALAPAYAAAVAPLRDLVPPERYAELAAEVRGSTLREANRRAQGMVRDYLPAPSLTSTPTPDAAESEPSARQLTPRELDVLEQLVTGRTNRDIADALGLAPKTVMHHTVAIYRKLGVRGRAEAVAWALRSGTVAPR
jgi:predicted ATPase/DNA-binding CsgD family transcriptional regulator